MYFGFPAYFHANDRKMELTAIKCIFLGYATRVKVVDCCISIRTKDSKIIISIDVTIDKYDMYIQGGESTSLARK